MRSTGRIIITVFILFFANRIFALEIETSLKDSKINTGSSTQLTFKISGDISAIRPVKVPEVAGLDISYSGKSMQYQNINGKVWRGIILTYGIYAGKKGRYRIPSFIFDVSGRKLKSREVVLIVTKGSFRDDDGIKRLGPEYAISGKKAYIGEPIILRYFLLSTGLKSINVIGIEKKPESKGLIINDYNENIDDEIVKVENIELVKSHISTMLLLPAESGNLKAGGGSVKVSFDLNDSFFRFTRQKLVKFEIIDLNILPLPEKGQPVDFHGDVGDFKLSVDISTDPVNMYDEKKLKIKITGRGNFLSMTMPQVGKKALGLKIIKDETKSNIKIIDNRIEGEKNFVYTIIPEKSGTIDMGSIRFSFFNPVKKIYETIESERISFLVKGTEGKEDGDRGDGFDTSDKNKIHINPLYLILIFLSVIIVITFVIIRDRKKYRSIPGKKGNGEGEEIEQVQVNNSNLDMLIQDMKRGLEINDTELFVASANRSVNLMSKNAAAPSLSDDFTLQINKLKDEINSFRYGGNRISYDDMKRIYSDLEEIKIRAGG